MPKIAKIANNQDKLYQWKNSPLKNSDATKLDKNNVKDVFLIFRITQQKKAPHWGAFSAD